VTGAPFNVLVSSAGRRVALLRLFREALAGLGLEGAVLATDMSRLSSAFQLADEAFVVPPCRSLDFVPAMLELCRAHAVRLVVPTIDPELPVYAAHRAEFAAVGTTVAVSGPEAVTLAGTKDRTHAWLVERGFPTVRQASVTEVLADPEAWPFPLVAKPVGGSASVGVAVVRDLRALTEATGDGDYVVQALARGEEHTVDVLCDRRGRSLCAVPRKRLEVRSGEVQKGVTVRHRGLERLARDVCEALPEVFGALCVQVFLDPATGEMAVIEINPRFGGGHPLACAAGADFPRWLVEEVAGLPVSARDDAWRSGLVMLRYDDAAFVDSAAAGLGALRARPAGSRER
jgi:carbamoyl-phosphate synthase large subunit